MIRPVAGMDHYRQELHADTLPFKFIAIAAGVASMNLSTFIIATLIGRTLHFVTVLAAFWGRQLLQLIEKYERWVIGLGIAALIGLGIAYAAR